MNSFDKIEKFSMTKPYEIKNLRTEQKRIMALNLTVYNLIEISLDFPSLLFNLLTYIPQKPPKNVFILFLLNIFIQDENLQTLFFRSIHAEFTCTSRTPR